MTRPPRAIVTLLQTRCLCNPPLTQIPRRPSTHILSTLKSHTPCLTSSTPSTPSRNFSTTSHLTAKPKKAPSDKRIALIRYHMQHPRTPRPLRFSRMRSLRHWTIHRAWLLFRRKQRSAEATELERQYNSMHAAMEALRLLNGPGDVGKEVGGRLYRAALEKKGVFGHGGVPIGYARGLVDTPGKEPWDHRWKR